jgi:hypothetical protein
MQISNYKQVLLTLVTDLQQLKNFAEQLNLGDLSKLINTLIQRIEADSFSMAILGEFKRGKSTFINALLGQEILPSDVLPTTATLNRVIYDSDPSVTIVFRDGEERQITLDRLISFVTKVTPECEAVAATVKEAVIHYPINLLKNNHAEIIDTPGLSDDENMTEVTFSILSQVEVAIMVTSALAPFSESEGRFLTEKLLLANFGRIIFIVNQIDHFKHEPDIEKIINLVKKRIHSSVQTWAEEQFTKDSDEYHFYLQKIGEPIVFGLSAYQALLAKKSQDSQLLVQSRFPEFEVALQSILQQERGTIILKLLINHLLFSSTQIIQSIQQQSQNQGIQQNSLNHQCASIEKILRKLKQIKSQELGQSSINEKIKSQVDLLVNRLEEKLKEAATEIIDSKEANPSTGIKVLTEQFSKYVFDAVETANQEITSAINQTIKEELKKSLNSLSDFLKISLEVIQSITLKLTDLGEKETNSEEIIKTLNQLDQKLKEFDSEPSSDLPKLFPSNSQIFRLEDNANGVFTAVGGVAGSLLGGPIGIAVGAGIGAAIGDFQKAKKFKLNYKPRVLEVIEREVKSHNVQQKINDYIDLVCGDLENNKKQIEQEINNWLDDANNTVAKLQGKQKAVVENECKKLEEMHNQTQAIFTQARNLFEQLTQINQNGTATKVNQKIICQNCHYENLINSKFCIKCGTALN